jgi:hypothetical protein
MLIRVWRRRQRQPGSPIQQPAFFRSEHVPEATRIDHPLPLIRRHSSQPANRVLHHLAALRWQIPHLRKHATCLLLLFRSQVLPNLHTIQHALLLLRRQAVEVLQSVFQPLLALRRQATELGIILQRSALLLRRDSLVLAQPLAGMMSLLRSLINLRWRALCRGMRHTMILLRHAGNGKAYRHG